MSFQPPGGPPPPHPPGGPPPSGNPYPPQGYPGPQQPWSQQQWAGGPPPKKRGSGWKWGLGALALLVVIGVTAAVTISVTGDGADGADGGPSPTGETFGLASANDKGPANIITEDPSCAAWTPLVRTLAEIQEKGWKERDRSIPATQWTPELRAQYEEVADAMRSAADQTVQLAKVTPHRVMRELYEQFIAYARAYVDAIPTYTEPANDLVGVASATSNALTDICTAIRYKSAAARAPLVGSPPDPTTIAKLTDPRYPQRFLAQAEATCNEWIETLEKFDRNSAAVAWQQIDANIIASQWNAEQRKTIEAVIPLMNSLADDIQELGLRSDNSTLQDFAILAAQYRRAYTQALPSYSTSDSYLVAASSDLTSAIADGCRTSES